jgi:hypothetical protein
LTDFLAQTWSDGPTRTDILVKPSNNRIRPGQFKCEAEISQGPLLFFGRFFSTQSITFGEKEDVAAQTDPESRDGNLSQGVACTHLEPTETLCSDRPTPIPGVTMGIRCLGVIVLI